MNMIGAPKHVKKALAAGADIICAQGFYSYVENLFSILKAFVVSGGEGGGHTGDVPTSVLIPAVVDLCKGRRSALTGQQVSKRVLTHWRSDVDVCVDCGSGCWRYLRWPRSGSSVVVWCAGGVGGHALCVRQGGWRAAASSSTSSL